MAVSKATLHVLECECERDMEIVAAKVAAGQQSGLNDVMDRVMQRSPDKALQFFRALYDMKDLTLPMNMYGTALLAAQSLPDVQWVLSVMDKVDAKIPPSKWSRVARSTLSSGDFDVAEEVLSAMQKNGVAVEGSLHAMFMRKLISRKEWDRCFSLFRILCRTKNVDSKICRLVLQASVESGNIEIGREVNDCLRNAGVVLDFDFQRHKIDFLKMVGDWRQVLDTVEQLENMGECDRDIMSAAITAAVKLEEPVVAAKYIEMASKSHARVDQSLLADVFDMFVRGQEPSSGINHCVAQLVVGIEAKSAGKMLSTCVDARRWDLFWMLLDKIGQVGGFQIPTFQLNLALKRCQDESDVDKSREIITYMLEKGPEPDMFSYSLYMSTCVKTRQSANALEMYDNIKARGVMRNVVIHNIAIRAMMDVQDGHLRVDSLLQDMEAEGCKPDIRSYNTLLALSLKNGEAAEAVKLVDKINAEGYEFDTYTYRALLQAYSMTGQTDKAWDLLSSMRSSCVVGDRCSFKYLVEACSQKKETHRVVQLLEVMKRGRVKPDELFYVAAIRSCAEDESAQSQDKAVSLIKEMRCNGMSPHTHVYNLALKACGDMKDADSALELLDCMTEDMIPKVEETYDLAITACQVGRKSRAAKKLEAEKQKRFPWQES